MKQQGQETEVVNCLNSVTNGQNEKWTDEWMDRLMDVQINQ